MVRAGNEGPTHLDLTHGLSVQRGVAAVVGADAHIHQRHRHAGHRGAAIALVGTHRPQLGTRVRDRRQRRCLGHAPALQQPHAVPVEGADQRLGHRRPADQRAHALRHLPAAGLLRQAALVGLDQAEPDGRHAQRQRGRLLLHQVEQVVRVQVRSRKNQLHAHHHGGVRDAPAVGVEHRRHRHQHVGALQAPEVGQAADQRVQDGRTVRVGHALGPAGGARRVAHRHRVVLVVRRVDEAVGVRIGEQLLVVVEALGHRRAGEREHDDAFEAVQLGELPVQRQQDVVDDQEAVLRVGGDPADLGGRQAQVQRVHHAAGRRDAEVGLQMSMVVPAQRGDTLALLQPE